LAGKSIIDQAKKFWLDSGHIVQKRHIKFKIILRCY